MSGWDAFGNWAQDVGDTIMGKDRYKIQGQNYNSARPDEERAMALQQRAQQQELAGAIQQRALGQGGPSVAEMQAQRGLGQAQAQAANQLASARGVDRAAAFRQAQQNQQQMQSQNIADTSMLRAQEQIAAQQLGVGAQQGIREQDLASRGISSQEQIAQLQAQTAAEKMRAEQSAGNTERGQKAAGGILMAAGGLLSDMRAKEDIKRISAEDAALMAALDRIEKKQVGAIQSRENLAAVEPYSFRYKPEAAARMGTDAAPREGVMAQDLQRSPSYKAAVVPTPQGLALDKDRLLQANTAELGGLDKRLKQIEDEKLMRALDAAGEDQIRKIRGAGRESPKAAGR